MAASPRDPAGGGEPPAKPALTRAGIVATAVAVTRAEGLEKVTMRRLAQELCTGPASLYVYMQGTAELHAAVLDAMLGEVDLGPARVGGDWRDRLVRILSSYAAVLFEHPGLARSALVARPFGPHYLRLLDALLALLAEGRVPADRAAWGADMLLQFATATAAEWADRDTAPGAPAETAALRTAAHDVSPRTHPHLAAAVADDLLSGTGSDRLAWGFHVLINGIGQTGRPDAPALH